MLFPFVVLVVGGILRRALMSDHLSFVLLPVLLPQVIELLVLLLLSLLVLISPE